jgi:hypothetical protein
MIPSPPTQTAYDQCPAALRKAVSSCRQLDLSRKSYRPPDQTIAELRIEAHRRECCHEDSNKAKNELGDCTSGDLTRRKHDDEGDEYTLRESVVMRAMNVL